MRYYKYNETILYKPEDTITFNDVLKFRKWNYIDNTQDQPYFFKDKDLTKWFDHNKARIGSRFYDANNGDLRRVIAIDKGYTMIVQNITQGFFIIADIHTPSKF